MCKGDVTNERQYLVKALTFLKHYQWLFKHKNTDIFTEEVLTNLSKEWRDYCSQLTVTELHNFVTGTVVKEPIPSDLKDLIDDVKCLSVNDKTNEILNNTVDVGKSVVGLSRKKSHEIALLAPIIHEICQRNGCDVLIDVGSGVGHLSHLLCTKYGYPVLALEASKTLIETAVKLQQKHHPQCINKVVFTELFVSANSSEIIHQYIRKYFPNARKIGLVGLHACADLSVEVLKLYSNLPNVTCLVIMPCCYHRMSLVDSEERRFHSFPASQLGLDLFKKYETGGFLNQQFLRLACQQSLSSFVRMNEEEHQMHAQHCVHRAILELVAKFENCGVRRLKRKSGKSDASDSDGGFIDYLTNLPRTHKLVGGKRITVTDASFLSLMREKWNERKNDCWLVEVLMGLQAAIQAVCENVILLDRVAFLKEKGLHCCMRKITNDAVSPRCWALISERNIPASVR